MATPQYANAVFALGSPNGPRKQIRGYVSDAAGAVTWPDGSSEITLSSQNVYLIDFYTPTGMATMVTYTFYVGGEPKHVGATTTDIATTINRSFQVAPLMIPGGASLRIVQA